MFVNINVKNQSKNISKRQTEIPFLLNSFHLILPPTSRHVGAKVHLNVQHFVLMMVQQLKWNFSIVFFVEKQPKSPT